MLFYCQCAATDHDFTQFVAFGPDVVHQHLIGSELVLDWQRVVLALLHLLQLDFFTQVSHHLNPASSLVEAKGTVGTSFIPDCTTLCDMHAEL